MDRTSRAHTKMLRFGLSGAVSAFVVSVLLSGCGGGGSASSATYSPITEFPPSDSSFLDTSSPIGFYSSGKLAGAGAFADEGEGWVKLARFRDRRYASLTMIRDVYAAASQFRAEFPSGERLQLGDIAAKNGGYISGHASHQNGLDGDFGYFTVAGIERDPSSTASDTFAEVFVKNGKLTSNFNLAKNWAILRNFVAQGNVNRIFVDPVIKAALCKAAPVLDPALSAAARTEVLHRLNPYPNHDDHFHVRLQCPANHPQCTRQSDPAAGSGCASVSASSGGLDEIVPEMTAEQIDAADLGEDQD